MNDVIIFEHKGGIVVINDIKYLAYYFPVRLESNGKVFLRFKNRYDTVSYKLGSGRDEYTAKEALTNFYAKRLCQIVPLYRGRKM